VLAEGGTAPDFELPDQNGDPVRLSDLKGQTVILYFYPRADTPGCTTQACGVRDRSAEYEAAGAQVIGVSPDEVEAVKKFAHKFDLEFTLLADADHAVAEAYGAWVQKSMYGKKYMGVQRATFVIDPDGKIAQVFPKVSPKTHDDVVLDAREPAPVGVPLNFFRRRLVAVRGRRRGKSTRRFTPTGAGSQAPTATTTMYAV
jgi:thioredoxin-dependent peroxiredoxin